MFRPGIAWWKYRLWPKKGPQELTKVEFAIEWESSQREFDACVERERAAAKEQCKVMTVPKAWKIVQSYLCTNQYDVENMSKADIDVYCHAKQLVDNHIKRTT